MCSTDFMVDVDCSVSHQTQTLQIDTSVCTITTTTATTKMIHLAGLDFFVVVAVFCSHFHLLLRWSFRRCLFLALSLLEFCCRTLHVAVVAFCYFGRQLGDMHPLQFDGACTIACGKNKSISQWTRKFQMCRALGLRLVNVHNCRCHWTSATINFISRENSIASLKKTPRISNRRCQSITRLRTHTQTSIHIKPDVCRSSKLALNLFIKTNIY